MTKDQNVLSAAKNARKSRTTMEPPSRVYIRLTRLVLSLVESRSEHTNGVFTNAMRKIHQQEIERGTLKMPVPAGL